MTLEPLVLTVQIDRRSFTHLDRLRQTYFPPDRNVVPAHITLFHQLPRREHQAITAHLRDVCGDRSAFSITSTGVRLLGRGVAIELASESLQSLRAQLARDWAGWLSLQDRRTFRPHVTIQNKVEPSDAKALHSRLSLVFAPMHIQGLGLCLWRYMGGPWEKLGEFTFGASPETTQASALVERPHPVTPDGRYFVVGGRLWRCSNPALDATERERLVKELMSARRDVAKAKADGGARLAEARARVDAAKRALGERGSPWWTDGAPDFNRRLATNTPYAEWFTGLPRAQ